MSWPTVKLGEVFTFLPKSKLQASKGLKFGNYKFYTSSLVQKKWIDNATFDTEGLVFGTGGSASIHYANGKFSTSTDCYVIQPIEKRSTCTKYVYHYLVSNLNLLEEGFKGAGLRHISKEYLFNLKIKFPPLAEQQRIAAILDKAVHIKRKRESAIETIENIKQSIFFEMFGNVLSNENKWDDTLFLGEIADIASGITKGRKIKENKVRAIPYLAVANVQDKKLNLTVVKEIEATDGEIEKYSLKLNDLLLTEGGDPDKLGRGTLWNQEIHECIHQNHIFRVRLKDERFNPIFLNWLVGSQRGKNYFLKSAKQTTGIASINMTQLKNFPLLAPPVDLQNKFSNAIRNVDNMTAVVNSHHKNLESLCNSLRNEAFIAEFNA